MVEEVTPTAADTEQFRVFVVLRFKTSGRLCIAFHLFFVVSVASGEAKASGKQGDTFLWGRTSVGNVKSGTA